MEKKIKIWKKYKYGKNINIKNIKKIKTYKKIKIWKKYKYKKILKS